MFTLSKEIQDKIIENATPFTVDSVTIRLEIVNLSSESVEVVFHFSDHSGKVLASSNNITLHKTDTISLVDVKNFEVSVRYEDTPYFLGSI
ncbi:hypothetical protein KC887_02815 [Candidatus Kaiserbacteria bacterium]|nr:hypothetical protein [Candidatus Kaiserbacteria bacterium]